MSNVECSNCGGTNLSWFTSLQNKSDVEDGRLRINEVRCVFVLGCDDCSETLKVVDSDVVAAKLPVDL